MPLEIERLDGGVIVEIRATGEALLSDWQAVERQGRERAGSGPRPGVIIDLRGRETLPAGHTAERAGALLQGWPATAIVAREGAQYGIARMVDAIGESVGARVAAFTDREEALAWLRSQLGLT